MHRIDTATRSVDLHGAGKDGFRDGTPPSTLAPTDLDADWFNALQEEVANAVEGFGGTLAKANKSQLLQLLARQAVKSALNFHVADDTGAGDLTAMTRKTSDRTLVAVGTSGTIERAQTGAFSPATVGAPFTGDFNDVVYEPTLDLFIAVGAAGEIQSSSSGTSWARRANGGGDFRGVTSNGAGVLVAVGNGEHLKRSLNGTSWAGQTSPFAGTPDIVSVAYGAGLFVMVTDDDGIASSSDGITWTQRQAPTGLTAGRARVGYNATLGFLYHCNASVYKSADGITWTLLHSAVQTSAFVAGLVLVGGAWLIVDASSSDCTHVEARIGTATTDAAADFRIDFLLARQCTWMRVLDSQLWLLTGDQVWAGGAV